MAERQPTVFIVNHANQHDYSQAERFGKLVSITQGNVNVFRVSRLLWEVRKKMENYEEGDYILITGHSVINILVAIEALLKTHKVNFLLYGARFTDYALSTIELDFWPLLGRAFQLYSKLSSVVDTILEMKEEELQEIIDVIRGKSRERTMPDKISKSVSCLHQDSI